MSVLSGCISSQWSCAPLVYVLNAYCNAPSFVCPLRCHSKDILTRIIWVFSKIHLSLRSWLSATKHTFIWLPRWLKWWRVDQPVQETWVQSLVGKTPGVGNGDPLQYSCLENPMDRGAWQAWDRKESYTDTHTRLYILFREESPKGEWHVCVQNLFFQWLMNSKRFPELKFRC